MSLIPELESMFRQNGRRISDEISSGINSYGGYQQEYETGQPKAVPKPLPGSGLSTNCITPATGIIPKYLDPKLIGCVSTKVSTKLVNALVKQAINANPGPSWIKRVISDVSIPFPEMKLTVELWHFIPVHPGSMRRILEPLRDYLERKEGAYTVSVVGNLKAKKTFENHFGINLDGLLKLAGLSDPVPQSKFYNYHWHVYATFPPTIEKHLRKIGWTNLDKFAFNKFNLPAPHAPMVERVARDIVESWLTHKKITRVHLQGHTDKIGKEPYNMELGKKRATAVRDAIMEAVKQIAPFRPYDLDPSKMRIQYVIESLGETKPISRDSAENRRVEVRFHFTTGAKIKPVQLEDVVIRATRLLKGRNSMDQEKVKKLLCVLSKMRLPNPDDRFIGGGQAVLNIKNSNKFPTPEEWNRVRLQLTFPNMFGSHIPDDQFLRGLESLEDMISGGLREMNRIKDYDGGIPTFGNMATPAAMMQLFVQVDQMARDKNSVYSCY